MKTEDIWKQFHKQLLAFIKARVASSENAEDLLQEVFVKIHKHVGEVQNEKKLLSWLYQITRNALIDFYRKKKIPLSESFEQDFPQQLQEQDELNPQFVKCLSPFIEQLPEKYKEALVLTSFKGLSQKQYAEQQKLTYSAAKSRVQRARALVKNSFTACCAIQTDSYGNIISSNIENCSC